MQALGVTDVAETMALLVSGVMAEWVGYGAAVTSYNGADLLSVVPDGGMDPRRFVRAALVDREPSSLTTLTPAVRQAIQAVGPGGAVVVLTDGVPGDVDVLTTELEDHPNVRCVLLTLGVSRHGLPSDRNASWWREELAALDGVAALEHAGVIALAMDQRRQLVLDETRDAEFARALTTTLGGRSE
jgi:hypothetical protein